MKSRLLPTTHITKLYQERLILLYIIVKWLPIDVGAIIEKEIREYAMKKHKTAALLFPSLITSICLVSWVGPTNQDERIKNEEGFTAQTIERIAGESAVAPPEPFVVVGARRVIRVERRLQELSDNITQCVDTQWKENNWFWTYLMHLEDHLYQFFVYMKTRNREFPDIYCSNLTSIQQKKML